MSDAPTKSLGIGSGSPSKILVVDDQPINIKLLQRKLERQGMEVQVAYNGRECLEVVNADPPDLILLDVMMPEVDGIETCAHLKSNPKTETIPVLFITAKTSKEGKLEGLGVGAVDYITKPIDLDETLARVNTQLRLQEMFRENLELQQRLGESRRAAAVGAITEGIAHNLNNLLGVVVGYLDLMKVGVENPETVKRSVNLMDSAISRMIHIMRQLSRITSNDNMDLTPINLRDLITATVERFKKDYRIEADVKVSSTISADFKFDANLEGFEKGRRLQIRVLDEGSGIDPQVADTMFEPFITTKTSVGRGMGLTIARHTLRNLRGDLSVRNRETGGVVSEIQFYL